MICCRQPDCSVSSHPGKTFLEEASCLLSLFSLRQQKARDNRAAQRISKVQLSNDPLKRQQPSQQQQPQLQQQPPPPPQPPPGPYDPASMEADGTFKDPLRPKETEQEQEWKFRQVSRVSLCLSLTHHPPHEVETERESSTRLLPQTARFNQDTPTYT